MLPAPKISDSRIITEYERHRRAARLLSKDYFVTDRILPRLFKAAMSLGWIMRNAIFLSDFPIVSETFVLKQITGLNDMEHEIDIYAELTPEEGKPIHSEVIENGLLARTIYMYLPLESGY
jgi:hypothetical protein